MRLLLAIATTSVVLMCCSMNASAQSFGPSDGSSTIRSASSTSTIKYRGFVELGIGYDVFYDDIGIDASTSHGIQIGDGFFVGAYFNYYECSFGDDYSSSIGVDTRYFFHPSSRIHPYVGLQLGGGIDLAVMPMGGVSYNLGRINLSCGVKSTYMCDTLGLLFHFGVGF